jgi:hypothetical protein
MYEEDISVQTPNDDKRLWRYMDLCQFLSLIESRTVSGRSIPAKCSGHLYFCSLHQLREHHDEWEGVLSETARQEIDKDALASELRESYDLMNTTTRILCWHKDEYESVAMWKLYTSGKDGIAMQTTVGRLKQALSTDSNSTMLGCVTYIDYATSPTENSYDLTHHIFQKRTSYAHESEVRAVIPICEDSRNTPRGIKVEVDLSVLIERLVLSPQYPKWAVKSLENVIDKAGLSVKLESSDLLKRPEIERTAKH